MKSSWVHSTACPIAVGRVTLHQPNAVNKNLPTSSHLPGQIKTNTHALPAPLPPCGSFFFTLVTAGRRPFLASPAAVEVLRQAFRTVKARQPFGLDAIVILPDHLHCIWTLPPGDADFATRWRLVKSWLTTRCDPALRLTPNRARQAKGEQAIWQHRYWEHALGDETNFARHVDYIHFNPVKHGHTASVGDWPHSSFLRYVEAGLYPPDWGRDDMNFAGFGHE